MLVDFSARWCESCRMIAPAYEQAAFVAWAQCMRETIVRLWMILALAATALAGCEMSATSMPTECRMLGAQCQLASGPLGVCENVVCRDGQAGPCFHCSDQH